MPSESSTFPLLPCVHPTPSPGMPYSPFLVLQSKHCLQGQLLFLLLCEKIWPEQLKGNRIIVTYGLRGYSPPQWEGVAWELLGVAMGAHSMACSHRHVPGNRELIAEVELNLILQSPSSPHQEIHFLQLGSSLVRFQNLPKQWHPLGTKYPNAWAYGSILYSTCNIF